MPGIDFYVQIGDGGAVNGGMNTAPTITALDITGPGTIFHGRYTGVTADADGRGYRPVRPDAVDAPTTADQHRSHRPGRPVRWPT